MWGRERDKQWIKEIYFALEHKSSKVFLFLLFSSELTNDILFLTGMRDSVTNFTVLWIQSNPCTCTNSFARFPSKCSANEWRMKKMHNNACFYPLLGVGSIEVNSWCANSNVGCHYAIAEEEGGNKRVPAKRQTVDKQCGKHDVNMIFMFVSCIKSSVKSLCIAEASVNIYVTWFMYGMIYLPSLFLLLC